MPPRVAGMPPSTYGTLPTASFLNKPRIDFKLLIAIVASGACLSVLLCVTTYNADWSSDVPRMRLAVAPTIPLTYEQLVQPRQVHLAYAGRTPGTGMTVSWATYHRVNDSTLWVGSTPTNLSLATVDAETLSYYADDVYTLYTYHATVRGLTPRSKYFYRVGSASNGTVVVKKIADAEGGAIPATMTAVRLRLPCTLTLASAMRNKRYARATSPLSRAWAQVARLMDLRENFDFIWHVGDISYADNAFHTLNADTAALGFVYEKAYNAWMDALEPAMRVVRDIA
ncbi:hypothetical protein DYB32_009683, partial [Aphanomyces invadans]